jgi:hypothetical protein
MATIPAPDAYRAVAAGDLGGKVELRHVRPTVPGRAAVGHPVQSSPRIIDTSLAHAPTLEASSTDVMTARGRAHRTRWTIGALVALAGVAAVVVVRSMGSRDESTPLRGPEISVSASTTWTAPKFATAAPATEIDASSSTVPAIPISALPGPPGLTEPSKSPPPPVHPKNAASARPTDPLASPY